MTAKTASTASSDILSDLKSSVSDAVSDAVSGLGTAAVDELDKGRRATAAGIKSASKSLHEKADDLPGGVADVAHGAANKLNSTANYIRRRNVPALGRDLKKVLKDNPVPVFIGAVTLGVILAKLFSSHESN
jgi:hypothetical protein